MRLLFGVQIVNPTPLRFGDYSPKSKIANRLAFAVAALVAFFAAFNVQKAGRTATGAKIAFGHRGKLAALIFVGQAG